MVNVPLGAALGELFLEIVSLPFMLTSKWLGFIKRQQPIDAELTKASHGSVMIVLGIWATWSMVAHGVLATWIEYSYRGYAFLFFGFLVIWGAFWLIIGGARTLYYRDARLLGRAVGKLVFAALLFIFLRRQGPFGYLVVAAVRLVIWWCVITGLTKFLLLSRPLPRIPLPPIDPI